MTARYITAKVARNLAPRLNARDFAVLRSVMELRFVSGDQLARMCFDGQARAARRTLLRLTRLGVLERLPRQVGGVRAGSAGFVYRLGVAGQRIALDRNWMGDRKRRSTVPGSLFVDHALKVAELHTLMREADRSGRLELLELRAEPACWRRQAGINAQAFILKPDSYLRVGVGDFEDSYFIEVDMGTEGSRALESQLRAYVAYHASGREQAARGVFPKVLWLVPDSKRAGTIGACIKRLPRQDRGLFQVGLFADTIRVVSNTSADGEIVTSARKV